MIDGCNIACTFFPYKFSCGINGTEISYFEISKGSRIIWKHLDRDKIKHLNLWDLMGPCT